MSAVVLSALITVIAGLKLTVLPELVASNIVLVLGALSTVLAAWGAIFAPQESWHLYSETSGKLRSMKARLEFEQRAEDFNERESTIVSEVFNEYQTALADHNDRWQKLRQKSD